MIPLLNKVSDVQRSDAISPWMPSQSLRDQVYPKDTIVNWLPICLIHSPASISQLHALSSIDKLRLLLAMVPCKGSRRFPLNNISWVTAAAPRVKDMPGQPLFRPSNISSSSSSRSWSRSFRPTSLQDASQSILVYSTPTQGLLYVCIFSTGVFLWSYLKSAPQTRWWIYCYYKILFLIA